MYTGNVLIVNGSVRLTDYENVFFGLKNRLHDKLRKLPVRLISLSYSQTLKLYLEEPLNCGSTIE